MTKFQCRSHCGACCIAPSISSSIPGMSGTKAAGIACIHLDGDYRCKIFGSPLRPKVCENLKPSLEMCGRSREEALAYLTSLETATAPTPR